MFEIQNYAGFIVAILVFQAIPGPGTITILNATARNGVGAGMGAVLGTLAGDFVYMLAAVLGLAAIMAAHPGLFAALQWIGAGYLVWAGLQLLRARGATPDVPVPQRDARHFCRQAFTVALTNPKAALFFLAFFPLFLNPDAGAGTLAAMILHVSLLCLLWQTGLVLIGNLLARRLARLRHVRAVATRLAGVALVGFGIRLALDR